MVHFYNPVYIVEYSNIWSEIGRGYRNLQADLGTSQILIIELVQQWTCNLIVRGALRSKHRS